MAQVLLDSVPPQPTELATVDDRWAAIAREVPGGWGGLFLDGGVPTIYLVEPDLRTEAIDALIAFGIGQEFDMANARVWRGRWDFAQLAYATDGVLIFNKEGSEVMNVATIIQVRQLLSQHPPGT